MKTAFALSILSLLPAALGTTCVAESGCAGCGQVASAAFVQDGSDLVADSPSWGSLTLSGSTIELENVSGSVLTICNYGTVCYYISEHSSCTVGKPDSFNTELGIQFWQHP